MYTFHFMWQSQVENKHYSLAYFNHITAFKVLYLWTLIKGRQGSYMLHRLVNMWAFYKVHMSPTLNENFERSDVIKIRNRIIPAY